jgi:hypothetical protein
VSETSCRAGKFASRTLNVNNYSYAMLSIRKKKENTETGLALPSGERSGAAIYSVILDATIVFNSSIDQTYFSYFYFQI